MDSRNYAEVLIDGHVYRLAGEEDASYFQKVAGYINGKTEEMRKRPGFGKQSVEYQTVMVELNMADDYFKAQERIDAMERQKTEMEREIYSLKHELVSNQIKLEAALKELGALQARHGIVEGASEEVRQEAESEPAGERLEETGNTSAADGDANGQETGSVPAAPPYVKPSQKGGHGVRRGGKR